MDHPVGKAIIVLALSWCLTVGVLAYIDARIEAEISHLTKEDE